MLQLQGFHHVALIVSDYEKSKDFYTRILGLQIISEHFREERQSYKLNLALPNGDELELFSFPDPPPRPSYPEAAGLRHLAFKVANVAQSHQALVNEGIIPQEIRIDPYTGKKFFFFADPDDLPLEIYQVD
ncbi:MAG: VOC family protein [Bacteroidota bacterium]